MFALCAICVVAAAMCVPLPAHADYVELNSSSADTGFRYANWIPAEYSPSNVDPADYDYIVKDGKGLTTSSGEEVGARSLTFGEVGGTKGFFILYYSSTFTNGLVLANGAVRRRYAGLVDVPCGHKLADA